MQLFDVFVLLLTALLLVALWQHLSISRAAERVARQRTQQAGVVLLDQTVVLRSLRIARSRTSLFSLKRRFSFEFSSQGDVRYPGELVFLGAALVEVYMAPFKAERSLHQLH